MGKFYSIFYSISLLQRNNKTNKQTSTDAKFIFHIPGGFKSEDKGRLAKRREREQQREQQPQEETKITTTQAAVVSKYSFLV